MKITIDCRMINHSGVGRYLQNIIPRLLKIDRNNFYTLIGPSINLHKYLLQKTNNYKIVDCELPIFSIKSQLLIRHYIPADTELFWVPHFNIPFFYKGKMVVTMHDMLQFAYPKFSGNLLKNWAAKIYFFMAKFNADKVITVSNFSKKEIKKYLNLDTNVYVVYNGIDEKWFEVYKDINFHHYGKEYFLYVGNVKKHKNLQIFLQAMCEVRKYSNVKAIVVGKKEGLRTPDNSLNKYANQLGDDLEFTGFVSETELEQYYANAKALIFPSKYEGFGFPVLEAMATNCPVIASNAASLPEIGQQYALYFPPDNKDELVEKMNLVINNKEILNLHDAKDFARKYSWENCVLKINKILNGDIINEN